MELTYKNKLGEMLILKLTDNKILFKHDDICNEFQNLYPLNYTFNKDESIVITSFVRLCNTLIKD